MNCSRNIREVTRNPRADCLFAFTEYGPTARALGELARVRWRRATGKKIPGPFDLEKRLWPKGLNPDTKNVEVALSRTLAPYGKEKGVREVEALYLDGIASAERFDYLENQYFTCDRIGKAIAARLQEKDGPEFVIVLPRKCSGRLEDVSMGVVQSKLLARLKEGDPHRRLRIFYPTLPGLEENWINVHAKIMIVDNRLACVGSANLTNRSMGVDSECNLAVESATSENIQMGVSRFRSRLLGEHLDVSPEEVHGRTMDRASLISAIEALGGSARRLEPLPIDPPDWGDDVLPDPPAFDPVEPVDISKMVEEFIPEDDQVRPRRRIIFLLSLFLMIGLAAAWRWTPLNDYLSPEKLRILSDTIVQNPVGPVIVIAVYVLGGMVLFPVTLMILWTALTYGPVSGFLYAMAGCLLSAGTTYGIGHFLGRETIRKLSGTRLNRISKRLSNHGVIAVLSVRIVPVSPFTIVNLVAGASHIRFRDFLLGTLLGMAPGIFAMTLVGHRLEQAIRTPGLKSFSLLAGVGVLVFLSILYLRRRFLRR